MKFAVVVEKDEDGYYVASVPELPGCHTQAKTLDELMRRIREAIEVYLESEGVKATAPSGIVFRVAPRIEDLAGVDAGKIKVEKALEIIDKIRSEDRY
jgi:predicted RNase H-like HicB family nuclease